MRIFRRSLILLEIVDNWYSQCQGKNAPNLKVGLLAPVPPTPAKIRTVLLHTELGVEGLFGYSISGPKLLPLITMCVIRGHRAKTYH